MAYASANRTGLYRAKETVWGVVPTSPVWIETRMTGESMNDNLTTEISKELRQDRMIPDLIPVDASPGGSFNIEMSPASFDDLIESALMSTWGAELNIASSVIAAATGAGPHFTASSGTPFSAVVVGQWVKVAGFANAGNNGYFKVTAIGGSGANLTVAPPPSTVEAVGAAVTFDGSILRNGITEQSWSLLKILNDATVATRHLFTGMRVKTFSLDMQTASILNGAFGFAGKSGEWKETTEAGETFTAASTTGIMNCVQSVQDLLQDGGVVGSPGCVMSASMELDNQHREQKGIGVLGNVGVKAGTLKVTMNMSIYFESKAQADKFTAGTAFSFSYRLEDTITGAAYVITLPRCKFESFTADASGQDTDVMAETSAQATRDPTTNCMIQIDRFTA